MDILIGKPASRFFATWRLRVNRRWLESIVPLGVLLAAFLPRILGLNVFLTADEDDQIMFASQFLKSVLRGDFAGALVLGYPGVPTLILGAAGVGLRYLFHYAGWLPLPWVEADLLTTLDQVTTRFGVFEYPLDFLGWVRMPMALAASLSILGIYLLARRLLGQRLALLGTLIIAFDPFILAHSRIIHVDAPLSYFMFLSFLAFLLYLDQGRWKWLLLSGVCGGLAALSKTPAALLGPILVVSGLFYALFPAPGTAGAARWKRLGLALVGWGVVAMGAFFALWPAMWTRPTFAVTWIVRNIQSVNRSFHPTTGVFWEVQQSDQNPFYYLIAFPYHLTPLTTVGIIGGLALVGAGLVAWRRKGQDAVSAYAAGVLPLSLSLIAYVVLFIAPISLVSRRGDRYILPVFFAAGLLSALALWWLLLLVARFFPALAHRLADKWPWLSSTRLAVGIIFIQAFFVLMYHPYYLAYYNPVLGGYRTAPYQVNVGWGEGLDLAARYLNQATAGRGQQSEGELPRVAAWYSSQFAPFYRGLTIDLSSESAALTGDYTVFYINQVQRGFPSGEILDYFRQRRPKEIIKLGGIPYVWIYPGPVVSKSPPESYTFPANVVLGGGARLVGVDVPGLTMPADAFSAARNDSVRTDLPTPGGEALPGLPVTLYWETLAEIHGEHNIYIRLVDDEGNSWGQVDRLIMAGLWRPDRWHSGYFIRDEYRMPIDPATPPGTYQLEIGMYDFVTGQSYGVARDVGEIALTPPQIAPQVSDLNLEAARVTPVNDSLSLVGHNYADITLPHGAEVAGKIFWQALKPLDKDYDLEFAFISSNDNTKYVIDETPLVSTYPTSGWRQSEVVGAAYRVRIPAVAPAGTYPLRVTVIDPETGAAVGPAVKLASLTVEAHERNFELPSGVTPVSAFLDDEIELVGYRLEDETVAPRETFGLTLFWRSLRLADDNYTVFVHAVGPDQVIRGQWDSVPGQGKAPTSGWLPGQIVEDRYEVPMAKDAPPWKYDIFVGMYNSLHGERLPATSQVSPVSDDRVWITRIQAENRN